MPSTPYSATASAHPNIAFIKYWGNRDDVLRLPANGSISMNLDGLEARTQVTFSPEIPADTFTLNDRRVEGPGLTRVSQFLDIVRQRAGMEFKANVHSRNNFPTGVGIASSAAAFAALALAASHAAGLKLGEPEISALARRGSGSASRSIPGGFVEWLPGESEPSSYAISIAGPDHWDLVDCVTVVSSRHKPVGSTAGHALAWTSPLQAARVADAPRRLDICRQAVIHRDFAALAAIVELDSNLMHAVMMTSDPALFYWEPASIQLMKTIPEWRAEGLPVCYTLDAGPNVHVLCDAKASVTVEKRLREVFAVEQVLLAKPGGPAHLESI